MRDASGEAPDCFHLLRVVKLLFELSPLGDVTGDVDGAGHPVHLHQPRRHQGGDDGSVLAEQAQLDVFDNYAFGSSNGALFDSTLDRYSEFFIFFGFLVYFNSGWMFITVMLALMGSIMVSYIKARAEGLGLNADVGLIERPERVLIGLTAIGLSGLGMKYAAHTDIIALKEFMLGLMAFDWQPLPADPLLIVHLTLVLALMVVFPASKLLHAPGVFFSPTRNQPDDSRERRHVAPWAAQAEPRE